MERESVYSETALRSRGPIHTLTVDVEEYFQVEAFSAGISSDAWDAMPSRVVSSTRRVLDLFERYQAKGTFFFVGWVAERYPELVREVQAKGHELACHSHLHRPIYNLTVAQFKEDARRAKNAIEQAAGVAIQGYRAPTWSITRDSLWALDVLAEEGFSYDSSIFPVHHDLYGIPGARRFQHIHDLKSGRQLHEFPPTTMRLMGMTLPGAGGGYLRMLPFAYTRFVFRQLEKSDKQPAMVYVHPWEFDPEQPRIAAPFRSRLRHYTNLEHMQGRVAQLLQRHRFEPIRDRLARSLLPLPEGRPN